MGLVKGSSVWAVEDISWYGQLIAINNPSMNLVYSCKNSNWRTSQSLGFQIQAGFKACPVSCILY